MEISAACSKRKTLPTKTIICPCNTKYKRYVQPPRVKSFAPVRLYKAPSKRLDISTTYHLSYLNVDRTTARHARSQPIRPVHGLDKSSGQFFDQTTNKLSYRPVWQVIKAEPIIPKRRPVMGQGSIETVTTARHDYVAKCAEKPELIVPCGNIRTSLAPLDDRTMAKLSYIHPGLVEPAVNYKPIWKYRPASQPLAKETTQTLSYQPFVVGKKEFYPWAQKPVYKRPDIAMCDKTIYSESYMENDAVCVEKPILPPVTYPLHGAEFVDKTIYKESYLPGDAERTEPFIPTSNISIPDAKMSADTTNKLSYQQVWTEKRKPILPSSRSMLGTGMIQSETTTRCEYVAKITSRPNAIIPCGNIRTADVSLETNTTTGLSYTKPGVIEPVRSYKPVMQYYRPETKIDSETINKLSYQTWTPKCKEQLPWAEKSKYLPPVQTMANDTIYNMSYPLPGHYVEDDSYAYCSCSNDTKQTNILPVPAKAAC